MALRLSVSLPVGLPLTSSGPGEWRVVGPGGGEQAEAGRLLFHLLWLQGRSWLNEWDSPV